MRPCLRPITCYMRPLQQQVLRDGLLYLKDVLTNLYQKMRKLWWNIHLQTAFVVFSQCKFCLIGFERLQASCVKMEAGNNSSLFQTIQACFFPTVCLLKNSWRVGRVNIWQSVGPATGAVCLVAVFPNCFVCDAQTSMCNQCMSSCPKLLHMDRNSFVLAQSKKPGDQPGDQPGDLPGDLPGLVIRLKTTYDICYLECNIRLSLFEISLNISQTVTFALWCSSRFSSRQLLASKY